MVKCPSCGAELPDGSSFCEECGADIPQVKVCPSCGNEVSLTAKFCRFCKFNFTTATPATAAEPVLDAEVGKKVFVSYSRSDSAVVVPLVEQMQNQLGVKFWMDVNGIESGDQFDDVIMKAIDNCAVVLFMHSQNSLASDWTKREIMYADGERKKIVPILIDSDLPMGWFKFNFGTRDFIDLKNEGHCTKLMNNLKEWLGLAPRSTGSFQSVSSISASSVVSPSVQNSEIQPKNSVVTEEFLTQKIIDSTKYAIQELGLGSPSELYVKQFSGAAPMKKILNAMPKFRGAVESSQVVVYFDDTLFGSGTDCFIVTPYGIFVKAYLEDAKVYYFKDSPKVTFEGKKIFINGVKVDMTLSNLEKPVLYAYFYALVEAFTKDPEIMQFLKNAKYV